MYLLLFFPTVLAGSVALQYPLEEQLPVIARVNNTYSWTFANTTFVSSKDATLEYSASNLPIWLSFNPSARTFFGVPTQLDEGSSSIKVTAQDPKSSDSASSTFSLCVTSTPGPTVQHPVKDQFRLPNPSLSSVYLLSDHSAFKSSVPALRIPPKWSFSIGFQYDTFAPSNADGDVFYAALQTDGSPLPDWIKFNPRSITFNGVTPSVHEYSVPHTLSLALHASDQEGYSASSLPFDLWVSEHEVSLVTSSLPTINVTAGSSFSVTLNSPADFSGVLLDGSPIQPSDIVEMEVDTSYYGDWITYDTDSRTLTGDPPEDLNGGEENPVLPVTLVTDVNQTIETNVSLAVVPSYFSAASLQPVLVQSGRSLTFSLTQFFSNVSGINGQDDVSLSAAFDPENSTSFLNFDPTAATVSGTVPTNFTSYSHVTITFTAYSHITHSTSHTSLPISLTPADFANSHNISSSSGLSPSVRAKLLLGLKIAFGVVGGLVLFGLGLAAFRKWAHVPDTAMEGEEGTRAWTAEERKWYGIGIEVDDDDGKAYHDTEAVQLGRTQTRDYGGLGVGIGAADATFSPRSILQSPGVMRKSDFMDKIKSTARQVSDTYRRTLAVVSGSGNANARKKPIIGRPTLLVFEDGRRANADDLPFANRGTPGMLQDPFDDINTSQYAHSAMTGTSIVGSPSSSTDSKSIPRRRPDFGPPGAGRSPLLLTTPPLAHTANTHTLKLSRQMSNNSVTSLKTDESAGSLGTHAAEAVVQRAERARSVKSFGGRSSVFSLATHQTQQTVDTQSHDHSIGAETTTGAARPRLVPFTSSSRVPVPKLPSLHSTPVNTDDSARESGKGGKKRVVSQMAKVFRSVSTERRFKEGEGESAEGSDELSVGIEYVKALGDDLRSGDVSADASPSPSFSVAESSHFGHGDRGKTVPPVPNPVPRMLARTGEQFKFRVPLTLPSSAAAAFEIRLVSGKKLPRFVKVEFISGKGQLKKMAEFSGVPGKSDLGELNIGVYEKGTVGECVGRVILELVGARG
ncbi:hypothetical protein EW026_g6650 [Hermanssonia centrifuga]|uniref:Dystroglycan-type cadherin-like domain-containing protein n=1 Tax=Hermanssonia centrifuga TaxID=98765 RepID=A0A4S4KAD7_9APHY|nr:hypothetical protein EW026_g6650 [Hermanssonia centrifuga]